jgi:hypothetical protein
MPEYIYLPAGVSLCCCGPPPEPPSGSCDCPGGFPATMYVNFDGSAECACLSGQVPITYDESTGWWRGSASIGCDAAMHVELRCSGESEAGVAYIIFDCEPFNGLDFGGGTSGPMNGELFCSEDPFELFNTFNTVPGLLSSCGCDFPDFDGEILVTVRATP